MEQLNEGNSFFVDEQYEEALKCYDKACSELSNNAEAFFKRSQCHSKLSNLKEALSDINTSIKLDSNNSKYYLRKGQLCFELEEFDTALKTFEKGQSIDSENSSFKTWIRKSKAEIQSSTPTTTTPAPTSTPAPQTTNPVSTPTPTQKSTSTPTTSISTSTTTTTTTTDSSSSSTPKLPIPSSGNRVKHEWYQTESHVVLTIFAKFVTASNSKIILSPKSVNISFPLSTGSEFIFDMDLFDPIVDKDSTIHYYSTKVEIKMKKSRAIKWDTLEFTEKSGPVGLMDQTTTSSAVPSPYASKKDWDKLPNEPEDKLEGDQALNKIFRDIFAKGSEDQQRAMMKSFTESNGTVLSTNWDEVGSKKVVGEPPKGMEIKDYPH
ncbi:hypothetical protein ACTA71_011048 [Dictyostelium dimigraforme]